ncbi:nucleotide modification associated domain-containing protein [Pseudoalteromonas sp.]|uniref:nucleotide modification associated domain-containing protein n=1 Tax=Pseudoalteromonas sp. TaxID=53249 RepID=UPI00257BAF6B|nr:nucleotide modification associated domain-containing protein [Pseudoalteromonas sp.]
MSKSGMSNKDLVEFFENETTRMVELMKKKNADYAGGDSDPFANFKRVGSFKSTTPEQGFFTRMTDKVSRIDSFIANGKLQVKDESVKDTLRDLANYSLLFMAYLESEQMRDNNERVQINS